MKTQGAMKTLGGCAAFLAEAGLGLLLTACGGGSSTPIIPIGPAVTSIAVTPTTATIGAQVQFMAAVQGTGDYSSAVTWSIAGPAGSTLSTGTLSATGLYTTPYPAPATVSVTATSTEDPTVSGSATVTLSPPATMAGPALTVDASQQTHAISPYIYGMDAYLLNATQADIDAVAKTNITIDRWGGDSTERYNYQLDVTNSIADYYFENQTGNGGDGWQSVSGASAFDNLVQTNNADGIVTLGTVPVLGWVSKDSTSCSFPVATYPNQQKVDANRGCGNGIYADGVNGCTNTNGCEIVGNDPTVTSINEPPPTPPPASAVTAAWAQGTWAGGWATSLVSKFGSGNPGGSAGKGVAIYDLDNEPSWWDSNDFDVHPNPFTYDEVTNGGIGTALAIKIADPTAQVSGPVVDFWWDYFYSKKDVESGWSSGPCYQPWSNPVDRTAHGGIPFVQYYLQQFAAKEQTYGVRLLDYVDLHTYYAATYNGNSVAFATAGDTGVQQARLNSTRAFWDPTYTDPNIIQPNYTTDSNYTSSCTVPPQSPQLIPMMQSWVANDYPGTKLAIDEYNWGGMESINGALAEADILGIFGAYGLDLGTMWPTSDPSGQIPGMMAFAMYRNYDGNHSRFGDIALASTSANQGQLSVYGAQRSSDNAITIMVINKTYGDLTETFNLANVSSTGTAMTYLYSNANLGAIVGPASIAVTPPASGSTTSTLSTTFPAQSITLLVVPQT
jgi:Glycoside hydrolase family 44